ncbi:MAG: hypothetical protein AB9858_03700 [Acidaminococcaceae bacterium]
MKKMMLIFMTLFFVITNNAMANSIFKIDELDMDILMPPGYTVLTRNMGDSSEAMKALEIDKKDLEFMLTVKEVYLIALDSNRTHEVNIATDKSNDKLAKTIQDLNLFENTQIEKKMPEIMSAMKQAGKTPINNYVYTIKKAKYIVVDYWRKDEKGTNLYTRNYNTVKNGKMIVISFARLDGKELTKENTDIFKSIIDNIVFEEKTTKFVQASMGRTLLILGAGLIVLLGVFVIIVKRLNKAGKN